MSEVFPLPLYHCTSSFFRSSIEEKGLGGENPGSILVEAFRYLCTLAEQHLVDDFWWKSEGGTCRLIASQHKGKTASYSFQNGCTVLTPSYESAMRHALLYPTGSEILYYIQETLWRLMKASVDIDFERFPWLRSMENASNLIPLLVVVQECPVLSLITEDDAPVTSDSIAQVITELNEMDVMFSMGCAAGHDAKEVDEDRNFSRNLALSSLDYRLKTPIPVSQVQILSMPRDVCLRRSGALVAQYSLRNLDLKNAVLSMSYYYQSLPFCVVDAVISAGVHYAQVEQVIERLCREHEWERFRHRGSVYPSGESQLSMSGFLKAIGDSPIVNGEDAFRIIGNRGYINPRAKIGRTHKAEVIRQFATILKDNGIETFQDWAELYSDKKDAICDSIKLLPGMSKGVLLHYYEMLAGDANQVKPDRMILRFIEGATRNVVSPEEAVKIVQNACALLKSVYPSLSPRLLDHVIWNFQRSQ